MPLWRKKNRKGLTVLVHEVTDRDLHDHTEGALWMGDKVQLDFSAFTT